MLVVALTGCTSGTPNDGTAETGDAPVPSASATAPVALVPEGSAEQNLAYFDQVIGELEGSLDERPTGRALIDALVEAGFERDAMQVTPDRTAVDLEADNIEFSVRFDRSCIVGQVGDYGYRSRILPVLDTGECLVGSTRPIDW
jgi:hypothetical protein